ncbi:MAG: peptidase domain protein, partial [Bacteroidota bacterium]|nr:peptidase domain protein [Bacteroidota bacterium]
FSNFHPIVYTSDTEAYLTLDFSPNGRFLYGSNNNYLVQFDILNGDSELLIKYSDSLPYFGLSALMLDGKIYMAGWSGDNEYLSVIDSPDLKYPDCAFHLRSVYIPNSIQLGQPPNFPNYNLGPLIGSGCDTISDIKRQVIDGKQIRIVPNPANDYCTIQLQRLEGFYTAQFVDITGRVILSTKITNSTTQIPISNLPAGLYFVKISDASQQVGVAKLIKQ